MIDLNQGKAIISLPWFVYLPVMAIPFSAGPE